MAHYYPPPAFHFKVEVGGIGAGNDVRFSDVSGLSMELATEELAEAGENRFIQKYPVRAKYPELVLKRGLLVKSELFDWFRACIQDLRITPRDVDVKLLDANHDPLVTWHLVNAYPTKWALGDLGANSNAVSLETLQLYYQYFTVDASTVPPLNL
jgi:phage tail-like protein